MAMITEALAALDDRKGSSKQAIEKYIKTKYELGSTYSQSLK